MIDDYINFAAFFENIVSKEGFDANKYDKDFLDDENWFVLLSDAQKGICIPAIYEAGHLPCGWLGKYPGGKFKIY